MEIYMKKYGDLIKAITNLIFAIIYIILICVTDTTWKEIICGIMIMLCSFDFTFNMTKFYERSNNE